MLNFCSICSGLTEKGRLALCLHIVRFIAWLRGCAVLEFHVDMWCAVVWYALIAEIGCLPFGERERWLLDALA